MNESRVERHRRHLLTIRAYLQGKKYFVAADALQYSKGLMTGLRKDGVTPSFHHPLSVLHFCQTLPTVMHPEEVLIVACMHDLLEDYPNVVTLEYLRERFGEVVAEAVWVISKKADGIIKSPGKYFSDLTKNPIASIVKGADRLHNLHTMEGVFTPEKQLAYIEETLTWHIPMLREAGDNFPEQYKAYDNMKIALRLQIRPIRRLCELLLQKA